jgi:hypothetical protein
MDESRVVAFYRGEGRDHRGRLLSHILGFNFDELEFHHDYIQWLFPLPEPSGANPSAPLLSSSDIAAFTSDESLRKALLRSFELMLQFYGMDLDAGGGTVDVTRAGHFEERSRVWLTTGNHNFLRISRMLRSMTLLGLRDHARALLNQLETIYAEKAETVGTTTMGYWRRAAM